MGACGIVMERGDGVEFICGGGEVGWPAVVVIQVAGGG